MGQSVCCTRDGLLAHQSDEWVRGGRGRERKNGGEAWEERKMGKELRLLTDGCQRGAEVLLSPVRAQAACECVCMHPFVFVCLGIQNGVACACFSIYLYFVCAHCSVCVCVCVDSTGLHEVVCEGGDMQVRCLSVLVMLAVKQKSS